MTWHVVFLVVALVLFILASINIPSSRFGLGWAGLAFVTLYLMVAGGLLPVR